MRSAFDDGLDEDGEPDPEAQRAALDALLAPKPAAIAPPAPAKAAGYGAGLDGAALAKAQKRDALSKASDDTSAAIYATFARKPMPAAHETSDAANILQQRQGLDQEGAFTDKQQARTAKLAQEAEARDPGSEGSRLARVAIERADPQMAQQMGPQWERMSKSKLSELYGPDIVGKLLLAEAHRRGAAKGTISPDELAAQRAEAHRLFQDTDFSQMGPEAIKNFMAANGQAAGRSSADKRAQERAELSRQLAQARANHDKTMEAALTKRLEMMGEKLGVVKSKMAVPGFGPDDLNNPAATSPEQKNKLTDATTARDMLHSQAEELRGLLERNGGRLLPGTTDEARASAIWAAMDPQITITGGLGGFTEGHRGVTHDIKGGDLTSFRNLINTDRAPAMLEGVLREADEGVTHRARANRLHPLRPGESAPQPHFGPDMPNEVVHDLGGDDTVMVLPPHGDKPVPVHRSKLSDALKAGGRQVPGG